ncbi:uncharacterized protein LOC121562535 isoform X2 [Coregonus clupeaformis]|nr:uncharacterized protein LOC121562535 isoform X2 [Coregonus clupeaformis]
MHQEMSAIDGKDAVDIVCNTESEERDETLLALCRAFLSQQLHRGDMNCLWDLVFIWSKLHLRVNPSKQVFLEESHRLMLSATNIKSIFPFMRVILAELGKDGLQFCVELCTHALQTNPCDSATKSLIYKTVAYLLPNDLEVCRACALLVFFLERTVEAYKTVLLLYTHPDQEYNAEAGPIGNHIRFEILQTLKRGLYFDPEFWNLLNLRTNCLKLMSEKKAALARMVEEEDGWVSNYCTTTTKEPCRGRSADLSERVQTKHVEIKPAKPAQKHVQIKPFHQVTAPKRRFQKEEKNHISTAPVAAKRVKAQRLEKTVENTSVEPRQPPVNHVTAKAKKEKPAEPPEVEEQPVLKRRGRKPGPKPGPRSPARATESSAETASVRRSFRQLDMAQENLARQVGHGQHRHMTRLSEKKPPKRRGRKPRWLLEGTFQAENSAPRTGRQPGRKPPRQKTQQTPAEKTGAAVNESAAGQKDAATSRNKTAAARLTAPREQEGKRREETPATNRLPAAAPASDLKLEVSLPDNEVIGVFPEDSPSRRGLVTPNRDESKAPIQAQYQVKHRLGEEFILSTRNASLFIQRLHSYAQTPNAEGVTLNAETCLLKATDFRPSLNQSCLPVPGDASGLFYQTSATEMEVEVSSQTVTPTDVTFTPRGGAVERVEIPKNEEGFSTDPGQKCPLSVPSVNAIVPNNTGRRRTINTEVTNFPREPMEVTNVPKKLMASEVRDVLESSRNTEVTDILKEAMDIANIGVEEAMMGDTGSVPEKETPELVAPTPFCWLANSSMEAFAREFEKFAKGPDSDVEKNQEPVTPQTTDNVSHKTLETTLSTSPKVIPEDITDPVVPEDTSKVTEDTLQNMDTPHTQQLTEEIPQNTHDTPQYHENTSMHTADTQLDIKGTSQNTAPEDTPVAIENFPQLTGETRQLEKPLKGTVDTPEVPVDSPQDSDTPQITEDPPQITQDIGQLTEDTPEVTFTEVTVDTPKAVDTLSQNTQEDSSEAIEDTLKVTETPQKVTEDGLCVTVDASKHIEDNLQIQNTADTLQDTPKAPMVDEKPTKDTRDATHNNGDTQQVTEDTPRVPEDASREPKDTSKVTGDTPIVSEDTLKVTIDTSEVTEDLSMIAEDTPKVSEVTPQNTQYNSLVTLKVTESAHIPKVTPRVPENTSQDPKVTEDSPHKTQDTPKITKDTPMVSGDIAQNPEEGTPQENEDSQLAYRCSLCNKVFRGKRVITHAMYHFRRDQCMFCRMLFKNDLLAMMHLSQHIEKLKKGTVPADFEEVHENWTPDTPERSTQRGRRGRKRISVNSTDTAEPAPPDYRKLRSTSNRISVNSTDSTESTPPDRRILRSKPKLRSSTRLSTDSRPSPETRLTTEESEDKQSIQRVNGHVGRRRVEVEGTERDGDTRAEEQEKISRRQEEEHSALEQREEPVEISTSTGEQGGTSYSPLTKTLEEEEQPCSSAKTMEDKTESQSVLVTQDRLSVSPLETSVQGKETPSSCPVEGCAEIFIGKRRSLLGHILDDHRGDAKPLETTFRHGNGKCSICQKPGMTLQHYQHHIAWHRGIPRHPCLHHGCKARFSAAPEMRNHAKTHQPLRAVCCFPGCQERSACLLELNRHEREHYRLPEEGEDAPVFDTLVANAASVKVIKKCKVTKKPKKMKGVKRRWAPGEKEASAADPTTTAKVTRKCDFTKTLKKTQVIKKRRVHKDSDPPASAPPTVSVKVTSKLKKLQVKRKPCVGKKMNAPTAPITTAAEQVTKKLKMMHKKVKKAWAVKRQNVSKENYTPTGPLTSTTITTTEEVTKKQNIINKSEKIRVVKKPNVAEEKETGPATDEEVAEKSKVADKLKRTPPVKKQSVNKDPRKISSVSTDKDTPTVPPTAAPKDPKKLPKVTDKLKKTTLVLKKQRVKEPKRPAGEEHKKTSKKPAKSKTSGPEKRVNEVTEVPGSEDTEVVGGQSEEEDDKPLVGTSDSTASSVCDQKMVNGHLKEITKESPKYQKSIKTSTDTKSKKCKPRNHKPTTPKTPTTTPKTPIKKEAAKPPTFFGKISNRPYIRPPPTAYLDERYTTMPKRRKEMSWTLDRSPICPTLVEAAGETGTRLVHRQRCAKCFLSFDSGEELQTHLSLKKCANLFGFDSDEESK